MPSHVLHASPFWYFLLVKEEKLKWLTATVLNKNYDEVYFAIHSGEFSEKTPSYHIA
jgi:hypothetical protein